MQVIVLQRAFVVRLLFGQNNSIVFLFLFL